MILLHWGNLPYELLQEIFRYLEHPDLRRCSQVCEHWRDASTDNWIWKPYFEKYYLWFNDPLMQKSTYYEEFIYFKDYIPKAIYGIIDDFDYSTRFCKFSNNGSFFLVIGDDSHFCLYRTNPLEFLHERSVKNTLGWKNIRTASFSPNDEMILLNGERNDGLGEVAIFSISGSDDTTEVHFVSRVISNPTNFEPCWFDDKHILIGEIHEFNFTTPMGSSISQIWLCSVERITSESLLVPILRFLNRSGNVCSPLIANCVSPRFRRIIQLSEQAKQEGKTLRDKVDELTWSANIEEGDVEELKGILDKEQECYHCYLKHVLSQEEYGSSRECQCVCHNDAQKLLIYVSERFANRICFKVIDQKFISEALSMTRFKKKNHSNSDDEPVDTVESIMSQFDKQDYHIDFGGQIDYICLSPNQKSLYISLESIDINHENEEVGISHEIKTVDIEKMIKDPIGLRGKMKPINRHFVTVNQSLVASFTSNKIHIWSKGHRGPTIKTINNEETISCVALHPFEPMMIVTTGAKTLLLKP